MNKAARKVRANHLRLARTIVERLKDYGAYIYHDRSTSIYIHFRATDHKLRIGDHNERSRYGYKWQLRTDNGPIDRKKFSIYHTNVEALVSHFINYYKKVGLKKPEPDLPEYADGALGHTPESLPDDYYQDLYDEIHHGKD